MQTEPTPTRPARTGEPALVICALAMAIVLGVLLAPALQQEARAETVSQSAHLVALTANGGNEDVLLVLDNRTEQLIIYKVLNQNSMQMLQRVELPRLFDSARDKSLGRK